MASQEIPTLSAAAPLTGAEVLHVVQGGESVRALISAIATYVTAQIVDSSPAALDTLNELAAALGNDPNFATSTAAALAGKQDALSLISQADAEAGTSTAIEGWSALRIAQAIAALAGGGVPAGLVFQVYGNAAVSGTLKMNGTTWLRADFPRLWTFAQGSGVLASSEGSKQFWQFGPGNGSTTFSLPDIRGEHLRNWDDGRGIDSGRLIGSWQADALGSHRHLNGVGCRSSDSYMIYGTTSSGAPGQTSNTTGANVGGPASAQGYTQTVGSSENRVRTIATLACITY